VNNRKLLLAEPAKQRKAWAEGGGSPLSDDKIEIIRTWISQGAQDN